MFETEISHKSRCAGYKEHDIFVRFKICLLNPFRKTEEGEEGEEEEKKQKRRRRKKSTYWYNADKNEGGRAGTYYRGPAVWAPDCTAYVFVCPGSIIMCRFTNSDQTQVTQQLIVSRSAFAGVPEEIFSPRHEQVLDGPDNKCKLEKMTRARQNTVLPVKLNKASPF